MDLLRSFDWSQTTAKFFSFKLPITRRIFVLSWQFSRKLPTPVRAGALALNGFHALGDRQIKLKVGAPFS